jgi:hypothetical protein
MSIQISAKVKSSVEERGMLMRVRDLGKEIGLEIA